MKTLRIVIALALIACGIPRAFADETSLLLVPERVFDGVAMHSGWQVVVPGRRLIVATRAIVASGAYGPKGFEPGVDVPQGAEEASGDGVVLAARRQIAAGADLIKLYADYRWRPGEESRATFSEAEL